MPPVRYKLISSVLIFFYLLSQVKSTDTSQITNQQNPTGNINFIYKNIKFHSLIFITTFASSCLVAIRLNSFQIIEYKNHKTKPTITKEATKCTNRVLALTYISELDKVPALYRSTS